MNAERRPNAIPMIAYQLKQTYNPDVWRTRYNWIDRGAAVFEEGIHYPGFIPLEGNFMEVRRWT